MTSDDIQPAWDTVKLADILHRVRKPVQVEPDTLYREIGIRSHGKGIFYKEERTGSSLGDKSVFWIEPDCFVVNIVFAWEQAVAKTTQNELGMIASHRFPMYKPLEGKVDLDYLLYFFKSPLGKYLLGLASPGGAGRNKTLGQKGFLDLSIPLPSLPEQQKITDILSTWDKAIALTEQLIAAKQNRKRGLMQQLFTGKRRFREFEDEWKSTTLQRMVETKELLLVTDGDWVESKDQDPMGQVRLIQLADIGDGAFLNKSSKFLREQVADRMGCTYLQSGDILVARMPDPLGRACVFPGIDKKAVTAVDVCVIRTNNNAINRFWLAQHINSDNFRQQILSLASGTTRTRISRRNLGTIPFLVPSLSEQDRIGTVLQTCDAELNLLMQKLAVLKLQKQGLMQQSLTGKVRVKTG